MVTNVTKNILCFTDKHKVLQKVLQTNELGLTTWKNIKWASLMRAF